MYSRIFISENGTMLMLESMKNTINTLYLARALADSGLLKNIDTIEELIRIGKRLHRYFEHECNGYNAEKYERLSDKWSKKAHAIAKDMGAYLFIQSDPRGATIYIDNKPIPYDNYHKAICLI